MNEAPEIAEILSWCRAVLGPYEILYDSSREHPGRRASSLRLRTASGACYVKLHHDPSHWESEVHGYENWAPAFGNYAPRLLAVGDVEPLALIITELPGQTMEGFLLSAAQEQAAWKTAGRALADLHALPKGQFFGPIHRDGTPAGALFVDARAYVTSQFDDLEERADRGSLLTPDERAIVNSARDLIPAYKDEHPYPCHRDYCPANWLVTPDGVWTGVIDFEFSYWDTWAADFSRIPTWEWVHRPDLITAFMEGYGHAFTSAEQQQLIVAYAQYALVAVVWGEENAYHGFAGEGREALRYLSHLI